MKKKKFEPKRIQLEAHYSGPNSRDFWNIVNSMPDEASRSSAYSLGVAIQNLEGQLLKQIHDEGGPGLVAEKYWFNRRHSGTPHSHTEGGK